MKKLISIRINEILKQSAKIIKVGKPMSVVPEMRAIWDALRSQYQMVLGGSISPLEAANLSQKNALLPKWIDDKKKSGGGVLLYNAIHSIDKLCFLANSKS